MVSPDIPPVSMSRPSAAQQAGANNTVKPVVAEVTVEKAPTELYNQQQKIHLEGKVTASDPKTGEVRIATANGEVVVKTTTPLPIDADVALDLYMQKGQLVANIQVIRNTPPPTSETTTPPPVVAQPPAEPLPPMTIGSTFTAVFIPKDAPLPTSATLTPAQIETTLLQLAAPNMADLPDMPPVLKNVLAAADPWAAFSALAAPEQEVITAYLAKPDVMAALKNIMAIPAPADPADTNLLQIVRAQLSARLTHEAMQGIPAATTPVSTQGGMPQTLAANPALNLVKSMLPLIEGMTTPGPVFNAAFGANPLLQQATAAMAAQMPQNMHEIKIAMIVPGSSAPVTPQAGQITGTIESFTPKSFPVLQTDNGFFIVRGMTDAPVGSQVIFHTRALLPEDVFQSTTTNPVRGFSGFDPLTGFSWPALDDILQATATIAPGLAATLRDSLPAPNAKMTPAVLFFLAALRTGVIENWLGPTALNALRVSGKKDLVERLTGDFAKISNQAKTELPGEWRVISVPLRHDEQMSQMQFFLRQQPDPDHKDDAVDGIKKPMTRFVLNIHMNRMGDVQLDGLMHQKKIDVILRTADMLAESDRREIIQRFASGLEQTGMQGGITFQTRREGWITLTATDHQEVTA